MLKIPEFSSATRREKADHDLPLKISSTAR